MTGSVNAAARPLWLDMAAIALLLTATLKIMANATISPALPGLEVSFPDTVNAAYLTRFLVAAPSLSVVLVAPFAGLAADRFGRTPLLIAGVLLFAVSGSAGAYLPDLTAILVSRLLLGVAVALTMTAQVALVGDLFDGDRRSAFMGLQTAAINFSGFLFIGFAGWLAGFSPRLPFLIYALPALLVPLLLPVLKQEKASRRDPTVLSETATGPSSSWWAPAVAVAGMTMVTVMLFFLMPSQLPFYLEENGWDGASGTAFGLGALTLTGGCVAMLFQRISGHFGLAVTFGIGFALFAAGFATLSLEASWVLILVGAAQIGAGYALAQPAFFMLALRLAPQNRRGRVSGMITTAMFSGQVVSPLLLTPLINLVGFALVYRWVAAAFFLFCVAAASIALFRKSRLANTS